MKRTIRIGDHVQSRYAAPWKGVVIGATYHKVYKKGGVYFHVVPMVDRSGNPQPIRRVKYLDPYWLKKTTIPDNQIKTNWL